MQDITGQNRLTETASFGFSFRPIAEEDNADIVFLGSSNTLIYFNEETNIAYFEWNVGISGLSETTFPFALESVIFTHGTSVFVNLKINHRYNSKTSHIALDEKLVS